MILFHIYIIIYLTPYLPSLYDQSDMISGKRYYISDMLDIFSHNCCQSKRHIQFVKLDNENCAPIICLYVYCTCSINKQLISMVQELKIYIFVVFVFGVDRFLSINFKVKPEKQSFKINYLINVFKSTVFLSTVWKFKHNVISF